jgi:DNA-binding phage protein
MAVVTIRPADPPRSSRAECSQHPSQAIRDSVSQALEKRDVDQLLACLFQLSQQHGIGEVARKMQTHRPLVYRMLRRGSNPKIRNIFTFLEIFDIQIQVVNKDREASTASAQESRLRDVVNG